MLTRTLLPNRKKSLKKAEKAKITADYTKTTNSVPNRAFSTSSEFSDFAYLPPQIRNSPADLIRCLLGDYSASTKSRKKSEKVENNNRVRRAPKERHVEYLRHFPTFPDYRLLPQRRKYGGDFSELARSVIGPYPAATEKVRACRKSRQYPKIPHLVLCWYSVRTLVFSYFRKSAQSGASFPDLSM